MVGCHCCGVQLLPAVHGHDHREHGAPHGRQILPLQRIGNRLGSHGVPSEFRDADSCQWLAGGSVLFILGSLLCAVAPSLHWLIAFRILQGIGTGILTPVSTAILYRVFKPEERSRVTALIVIPTVIAPTIGPIVGGYLVQYVAWQEVFWINIPLGLLGLLVAIAKRKEQIQKAEGSFDLTGFILGTSAGVAFFSTRQSSRRIRFVGSLSGNLCCFLSGFACGHCRDVLDERQACCPVSDTGHSSSRPWPGSA